MLRRLAALWIGILIAAPVLATEIRPSDKGHPISWQGWSSAAFDRAKQEHKFVILDLEAVWCHWCHVMDERTYSNPEVARLLNSKYIAVRVDQDSRPDLSNKYEDYGWPATIIFDADGTELVKRAGFIPPDEMVALLQDVVKNPTPGPSAVKQPELKYSADSSLSDKLRLDLLNKHIKGYDTKEGAWSTYQKFLDADSEELALTRAKSGDQQAAKMARFSLDQQIHLLDPVWGGMYQYSTNGDWKHAHFEKIMSVQADNLRVYSLGYSLFKDPKHLHAAQAIYGYLTKFLLSPEGAFYTSQDADVIKGKHSAGYFALSDAQRRKQGMPRIDKHVYARENGWAIAGIVELYKATGDKQYLDTASNAADWVLAHRALPGGGFSHGDKDAAGPFLGDTLYMGRAFLSLYEATGNRKWLTHANEAADFIAAHFANTAGGAGFVTADAKQSAVAKPDPLLDENIAAVRFFNRLYRYSGKEEYKKLAQNGMRYLATPEIANKRQILVAGILLADRELSSDPVHITVVGAKSDPTAQLLYKEALKYPISYTQIEWFDKSEGPLPNNDTEFPELPKAAAFGCAFKRCSLPIFAPEKIATTIDSFAAKH